MKTLRYLALILIAISSSVSAQLVCHEFNGTIVCEEQDYDSDHSFTCYRSANTTICEDD